MKTRTEWNTQMRKIALGIALIGALAMAPAILKGQGRS